MMERPMKMQQDTPNQQQNVLFHPAHPRSLQPEFEDRHFVQYESLQQEGTPTGQEPSLESLTANLNFVKSIIELEFSLLSRMTISLKSHNCKESTISHNLPVRDLFKDPVSITSPRANPHLNRIKQHLQSLYQSCRVFLLIYTLLIVEGWRLPFSQKYIDSLRYSDTDKKWQNYSCTKRAQLILLVSSFQDYLYSLVEVWRSQISQQDQSLTEYLQLNKSYFIS